LHFEHTISNPNVLLKSSDQQIYLDVFLGLSSSMGVGSAGVGTTSLREAACDESTPKYLTVCLWGAKRDHAHLLETTALHAGSPTRSTLVFDSFVNPSGAVGF
jgi:hypothetical protein